MGLPSLFIVVLGAIGALGYMPHMKDHYITDVLLREVVDRMGKDLAQAADTYLDMPDNSRFVYIPITSFNRYLKSYNYHEISFQSTSQQHFV